MIIDLILDRKDHEEATGNDSYDPYNFYREVMSYESIFELDRDISMALDYGTEDDVRKALCKYIDDQQYNPDIKNYVNSKTWLEPIVRRTL